MPFYFTPSRIAGFFHCVCPSLDETAYVFPFTIECMHATDSWPLPSSALLHAGHQVSRSHALPGSLKTSATRHDIHDVFRSWIKIHPVRLDKISETSPSHHLLAKEARYFNSLFSPTDKTNPFPTE